MARKRIFNYCMKLNKLGQVLAEQKLIPVVDNSDSVIHSVLIRTWHECVSSQLLELSLVFLGRANSSCSSKYTHLDMMGVSWSHLGLKPSQLLSMHTFLQHVLWAGMWVGPAE